MTAPTADELLATIPPDERAVLTAVADHLIPATDTMPSAAEVVDDVRLRFVLNARPDLLDAVRQALRPELGADVPARLDVLGRDEAAVLYALQLVIVSAYYTDRRVRDLIGYPGQMALEIRSWEVPAYLDEGLIDAVVARGPVWRDPSTGQRAVIADAPRTYAERYAAGAADAPEGGQ